MREQKKLNRYILLIVLLLSSCASKTFIGQLERTRTRMEPLDVTEVKTDRAIIKAYGRFTAPLKDSVYICERDGKKYLKFKSSDELYLVKE